MHILHTTPKTDGFSMPAEFERHAGCLLIWPERGDSWRSGGWPARKAFVAVASAIAQSETVTMLVSPAQYETARAMLPPEIRLVEMETDDSWARDVCPTFVRSAAGGIRGIDWGFNAWGGLEDGLYFPWDKDNLRQPGLYPGRRQHPQRRRGNYPHHGKLPVQRRTQSADDKGGDHRKTLRHAGCGKGAVAAQRHLRR